MTRESKRVTVIPGDDAAPEAVHPTLDLLRSLNLPIAWTVLPDGAELAKRHSRSEGARLVQEAIDASDTVLFGAASGSTPGVGYLRYGKQTFANIRPIKWRPGFRSPLRDPVGIDYIVVRENLEDMYVGIDGDLAELRASTLSLRSRSRPDGWLDNLTGKYAVKVITEENTERVTRFACMLARQRQAAGYPGRITCSAKYNVLRETDELFRRVARAIVEEDAALEYEEFIVDDFARRLVATPQAFDVVLLPNLFGDLLSDEGAGTIGGLGLAPSGCYGDGYAYFEPVHGTAPDIAGRYVINPTATILSAGMMLEYLGFAPAAQALEAAVERVYAAGDCLPPDQGGTASTEAFVEAVAEAITL